jgi:hypothetical protein
MTKSGNPNHDQRGRFSSSGGAGGKKPPHRASRQGGQHFGDSTQHTGGAFGKGPEPQPKYPNRVAGTIGRESMVMSKKDTPAQTAAKVAAAGARTRARKRK